MSDKERLVAEIDESLKSRASADPRSIREIVEKALEREFATGATAAVERRIDEKKQNIQRLKGEINERRREMAKEQDDLERLQKQLESYESRQETTLEEACQKLAGVEKDPENPAVKNWAEKVGVTPHRLVEELQDGDY